MAYYDLVWYCNAGDQSTTGYYAVSKRPQNAAVAAGQLVRQFTAPTVGNERVFVCIVAGTTANVTDATWVLTRGAKTTDNTVTWMEVTGIAAVNGDATNTVTWSAARVINTSATLGTIIKRNNGASYWICTTAGSLGTSEPAWPNDTAGTTQADGTTTWTCLGVVGNFTGGQAPHARLANVFGTSWFAIGNTVYVGDNHAESQASAITITPISAATPYQTNSIICHNHSGPYPPTSPTTGATVTATASSNVTISQTGGCTYVYGIAFSSANYLSLAQGASNWSYYDNCVFKETGSGQYILLSSNSVNALIWNNCKVFFGGTSNYIDTQNLQQFIWQNTGPILAAGSAVPTALLGADTGNRLNNVTLEALDLSQLTGNLLGYPVTYQFANIVVKDCKLNAAMTIGPPQAFGQIAQLVRSDSSGTGYKSARYLYEGTETTETAITRVGGAVDPTGQAQSRKIVTTANINWLRPFKAEPYAIWNPTTAANVTVTVYGTINAGALPNNDDIWLEVEYLGSSASPLGTFVTTTKANVLAANAAVASDGSTWNGASTSFATLDPASTLNAALSNGNLTTTYNGSGTNGGARNTTFRSSGKYYFEVTVGQHNSSNGSDTFGVLLSTGTINDLAGSGNCTSVVFNFGGAIWTNNTTSGKTLGSIVTGDVVGAAIDLDNRKAWFRKNGGNWNGLAIGSENPATNTGGVTIVSGSFAPAVAFNWANGDAMTANFGAITFAAAAPSGFTTWPTSTSWLPFKLTTTLSSPQPGLAGYLHARVRAAKPSTTYYLDPQITLS
jgi:hypothetical protein